MFSLFTIHLISHKKNLTQTGARSSLHQNTMATSSAPHAAHAMHPVLAPTLVHKDSTVPILCVDNLPVDELPIPDNLEEHQTPTKKKCAVKGCPLFAPIVLLETCSREVCEKLVHPVCYKKLITTAKKNHSQIADKQFCTIKCQELYLKDSKTSGYTWTNDGQNGKADPLHLENVLLTWLNTKENFSRWRDPEGAKTKLGVAADLVRYLKSNGCRGDRSPTQVQAKICHIKSLMRHAFEFIHLEMGKGIKASEPFESF